jgi:hypothetical protein
MVLANKRLVMVDIRYIMRVKTPPLPNHPQSSQQPLLARSNGHSSFVCATMKKRSTCSYGPHCVCLWSENLGEEPASPYPVKDKGKLAERMRGEGQ